ncbi:MAG: two-component regulator propeller domain-containing protein [Cytophagaceae bacterium]
MKITLLQFILVFQCIINLYGQQLRFEKITDKKGELSSTSNTILKDFRGFMWFGTQNGLSRYDGYNFINYYHDPNDPNTLNENNIMCLYESADSLLYIGTKSEGFCIFDHRTDKFTRFYHDKNNPNSLINNSILKITGDTIGNIWIATMDGLDMFDVKSKSITHYQLFPEARKQMVISMDFDNLGNMWVLGLSNKVCKFNPYTKSKSYYTFSYHAIHNTLFYNKGDITYDPYLDKVWIGNKIDGLVYLDPETGKTEEKNQLNKVVLGYNIISIIIDCKGDLWMASDGKGIFRVDKHSEKFEHYTHNPQDPQSLSSNGTIYMYESHPGLIWIATYASGLNLVKHKDQNFIKVTSAAEKGKGLSQKSVLSLAQTEDKILIGTDGGGLNILDKKTQQFTYLNSSTAKNYPDVVKSILVDRKGNVWCGTYGYGLCKLDPKKWNIEWYNQHSKNTSLKPTRDNVWSLCESRDGRLWMGLIAGGINIYDPATNTFIADAFENNGLEYARISSVFSLFEDSKGRMWIGTERHGLICYDGIDKKFHSITGGDLTNGNFAGKSVSDIFEDSQGNVWFASRVEGLARLLDFENRTFEKFTTKDGLPSNSIQSILEDDKGNLWISTYKGISSFNVKEKSFLNFDDDDGLQGREFNFNSKLKTNDGKLFFGGANGFNIFHPDSIKLNNSIPPVVFTDVKLFNKSLLPGAEYNGSIYLQKSITDTREITFNYFDDVISFEFASLSFHAPSKNKYAYKLEGFDQDWIYETAERRFATYTNLNPGTYTFRVIGSNNDNIWNTQGAFIQLTVLPPWWMTWWFKTLAISSLISAVFLLIYIRTKSIRLRNKVLEEEVNKKTSALVSVNEVLMEKNQEITLKNEILEENNAEIYRKTSKIIQQQEEILSQNQELEILNKTKDKFFSILAHDLKNPVNALVVLSKLLRKEFDSNPEEIIDQIEMSTERLNNLVLNLLDWARSQSGKLKADRLKINLTDLINENIELSQLQLNNKNLSVHSSINESHFILADYNMISAVVRNLLNNNIKFSLNGGEINIYSELINENKVAVVFEDKGVGMTEEILSGLFRLDNLVSSMGTSNETGTGLGMIICKEFIELNDGEIIVESEESNGTKFKVILPGGKGEAVKSINSYSISSRRKKTSDNSNSTIKQKVEENLLKEEFKGKKILLVDDDEQVRKSLKYLLAGYFDVYEALNVKSAIEISEKIFPDLIISDIIMPGVSGISFCHTIKSNKVTCHIPIILLTGQNSEDVHLNSLKAGADAFILKPFDRDILLITINNLFSSLENMKLHFTVDPEILVSTAAKSDLDKDLLKKAIDFIEKYISDPDLNGDRLAKELGLSKTLLYLKLKNLTGQTVNEFIRIIRLKKSTGLLIQGELSISEIASEIGFNSPSYFTRSFTQHFGYCPKTFISKQKEKRTSP